MILTKMVGLQELVSLNVVLFSLLQKIITNKKVLQQQSNLNLKKTCLRFFFIK